MNRKLRRTLKRNLKDDMAQNIADKIFQFNQLPQQCATCSSEFDKTDKKMLQSWKVVVRQEAVRLFCPHCVDMVKENIGEINESPKTDKNSVG